MTMFSKNYWIFFWCNFKRYISNIFYVLCILLKYAMITLIAIVGLAFSLEFYLNYMELPWAISATLLESIILLLLVFTHYETQFDMRMKYGRRK